jgi:SAM-dependent methyltransferase
MNKKFSKKTDDQIEIIRNAYNRTVDNYNNGIEDENQLPDEFKNSEKYKHFKRTLKSFESGSAVSKIKKFLDPQKGKNLLDIGSGINFITKKLHEWPSIYYGIDISPKIIQVSQNIVDQNNLEIGGLFVAEAAKLPFENDFFDICSIVGVLEYYDIHYIRKVFREIYRVLRPNSRMFADTLNFNHPDCETMIEFEGFLGRTRKNVPVAREFEKELNKLFSIEEVDETSLMRGYFVKVVK